MSHAPEFLFSHRFPGMIWNTFAVEAANLLALEVRDDSTFTTTFSLLDYSQNKFLLKDKSVAEPWWVSLASADQHTLLINRFMNKGGNPDQKSLIALDVPSGSIRWEVESFSFFDWNEQEIFGYRTAGDPQQAKINRATGSLTEEDWEQGKMSTPAERQRPVFYAEGSQHFGTIKEFLGRTDYAIVKGVEYLEFNDWIIMRAYAEESSKLANYLLVFDREGELRLTVKLGENLAGLGTDTFFILSGCLFLVQNKTDLAAYRL
ncbi:MAG TPA: DUF4905 domain-containing protein [Cyclobacteriaceae bacterium]|nr:DUF4905 domain-containing protein [Cyclobacteriaceae bacterium]HMV08794.1 DUF4905 domain-containing protein [Cyclobacteriaceae bacterium]HMW99940.1 DUF4905 domain-containing protein [Cyclobacteriaceae bacterium]HMX49197.1 DUF4905 domain-containing protein [Cyclobacteriaceae bacterium]HMY92761.1 DUF4905 domain-containing protein [Cyclobacteriaceae bacterium]